MEGYVDLLWCTVYVRCGFHGASERYPNWALRSTEKVCEVSKDVAESDFNEIIYICVRFGAERCAGSV